MNTTGLPQAREIVEKKEKFFPLLFPPPRSRLSLTLFLTSPKHFLSFLSLEFTFLFLLLASRVGTCRILAYLINSVFNFTGDSLSSFEDLRNERDSAKRENQSLEKEIQELKKKSEYCKQENQAPQKNLGSVKDEQGNLQKSLLSENPAAAKKEQETIKQLERKNTELDENVTKKTSEIEALKQELQKLQKLQKPEAETKAKDYELKNMKVENKHFHQDSNAKCGALSKGKEVKRLREMTGRVFRTVVTSL